jgi:hypothetical protein
MKQLTFGEVNTAIITGTFDAELGRIRQSIKTREEMLSLAFKASLSVGDTVKFTDRVRPTYLRGMKAEVVKINDKRIKIKLPEAVGRFSGIITTPVDLVEKV